MNLRARLVVGLVVSLLVLLLTFVSVIEFQKNYVQNEIDKRLDRLAEIAEIVIVEYETNRIDSQRVVDALWDGYIGVFQSEGVLSTIAAPSADPNLIPTVDIYSASVSPITGPTKSGIAQSVRSKTISLSDGRVALVGLATTDGDTSVARLRLTLALAGLFVAALILLLSWWSYRMGFGPIAKMIRDADAYSTGDSKRRLIVPKSNSETSLLAESLNRLIDSASSSEEKMRQFMADASHELRTPLTTLRGYTSLYLAGGIRSEEETRDAMNRMHAESIRMARMVNDLLQMIETESIDNLNFEKIEVSKLIENVVSDLRALDGSREFTWNAHNELQLHADRERCIQVLLALGTNALIHAGDAASISVLAEATSGGVRFEVRDSGCGISEEHLPYLFDRLYKVDASRTGGRGGGGLGLAIVAGIMRACGGNYGVESTVGVGTCFWVEFPDLRSSL